MLLGLAALGFGSPAAAADEVVPFREAWGWAVVIPVEVGNAGVHEFLLDTGATFSVLEPALAAEAGLLATHSVSVATLTGEDTAPAGRLPLRVGSVKVESVEVRVSALRAIRVDQPRIRGLLGQSALRHLEYTIDHDRRRLVLHATQAQDLTPTPAARPTLEARLGCGRSAARLVVDSGVGRPVLFAGNERRLDVELGRPVRAATNSGEAIWREGRVLSLCLAGRSTGPLSVVVRPDTSPPREEDGLLPSRFFARVRFGFSGTVVAVDLW